MTNTNTNFRIRSYYAYGRITVKFIPPTGEEWALVAKKKELPNADDIVCKKDTRDDYGSFITIAKKNNATSTTIIELSTDTRTSIEYGRKIYEDLVVMGFKPSLASAKKLK